MIEVATTGFDPDRQGIGSTWLPGSPDASRLFIPQLPTTFSQRRYLFALCGHSVPAGETHRLVSYRQKLVLGAETVQGQGNAAVTFVHELPVSTPDWSFADGNVTWCFRFIPGERQVPRLGITGTNPANNLPSSTTNPYGAFSALLYLDSSAALYQPPASGQPPGYAVQGVSTIYDVRNPWTAPNPIFDTLLHGPGDIVMYASVWQTATGGPNARPVFVPPPNFDVGALAPEDRFVLAFPQTKYRHIAGAMTLEVT